MYRPSGGSGGVGSPWPAAICGWVFAIGLLQASVAVAQLSPGDLSEAHRDLEGSLNCGACHSAEKGVDHARCLVCHQSLGERIDAGSGLHARPGYDDCKSCHIEHNGREFELVWWGERGQEAFEHELVGFRLQGSHDELGCRDCHRVALNAHADELAAQGKNLARTFLGLDTECLACHEDEHRGQFEGRLCTDCHLQSGWSPAAGFDHQTAAFELSGAHREVECLSCHQTIADGPEEENAYLRFVGLQFGQCSTCHRDEHEGRFGASCDQCHSTRDWRLVDSTRFDHSLTTYPLEGRHRALACDGCHRPGVSHDEVRHEQCTDCHADQHVGQFAKRSDGGACESCHTVEGFLPAHFSLADHDRTFELEGAHRELSCEQCHQQVALDSVPRELDSVPQENEWLPSSGESSNKTTRRFRFGSTRCADCHDDPHRDPHRDPDLGQSAAAKLGCEVCHSTARWPEVGFDHADTDFELTGPHRDLGCSTCHTASVEGSAGPVFGALDTTCDSCHEDQHGAQFAAADGSTDCLRCHLPANWIPASGFDHERDSRFSLQGAHQRLECVSCHRADLSMPDGPVRYRPMPIDCAGCHGGR